MRLAMLFCMFFSFNLSAADEKLTVANHLPGFNCQRTLAVIEEMALLATRDSNHEGALVAFSHLNYHYPDSCSCFEGIAHCVTGSMLTTASIKYIVDGAGYLTAFPAIAACLSLSWGAVSLDVYRQSEKIRKILLDYFNDQLHDGQFDNIINDLKDNESYLELEQIFEKYPKLNLDTNKIKTYYQVRDVKFQEHGI